MRWGGDNEEEAVRTWKSGKKKKDQNVDYLDKI